MKIIRHPQKKKLRRPVVALGNFDGVHVGHRGVVAAAVKAAHKKGGAAAVITFDPHPQEVIAPDRGLRLLTTLAEREALLAALGVDEVIVIKFSRRLQRLTSQEFIKRYLVDRLGASAVFVGYDYAFGRGRHAGIGELKAMGKRYGFGVTVVPPVRQGDQIAKSGRIREYLSSGEFARAIQMLGHPYRITGKVVRGHGRGKELGFPTANLRVDRRKLIPLEGVYAGYVDGLPAGRQGKKCAVNIGSSPTFGANKLLVEVHLLNFTGRLLGKTLRVDLFHRLRDERQFADAAKLQAQIKKDLVKVKLL